MSLSLGSCLGNFGPAYWATHNRSAINNNVLFMAFLVHLIKHGNEWWNKLGRIIVKTEQILTIKQNSWTESLYFILAYWFVCVCMMYGAYSIWLIAVQSYYI